MLEGSGESGLAHWMMTLVMVFFAMTAALPAAEAVTQKDIDNLKSQAASLKEQKS